MTIGYVFKAEYFLPENASNYVNILGDPFDITPRPLSGRRRRRAINKTESGFDDETHQRYERYEVDAEVVESDTDSPIDDGDANEEAEGDYKYNSIHDELVYHEDREAWKNDPMRLKHPQNFATSRWALYEGFGLVAKR